MQLVIQPLGQNSPPQILKRQLEYIWNRTLLLFWVLFWELHSFQYIITVLAYCKSILQTGFKMFQLTAKVKYVVQTRPKLGVFGFWLLVLPERNTRDYVELSDSDTKGGCSCGLAEHYRATISHRELCYVKVFPIMQAVWATGPDSHCAGREQPITKL